MADHTAIQWTDATWNPTVGCSIVSPGCTNCYAMQVARGLEQRFASKKYSGLTKVVNGNVVWTGLVRLDEAALLQPLKWKRPRRIFVNSMSDLFHESLTDEQIDQVFAVMALCPQHTFQVLTKRPERMRQYLSLARAHPVGLAAMEQTLISMAANPQSKVGAGVILQGDIAHLKVWPLPNVWLGVSTERQQEADERIPLLLQTPAAKRFISAEPLLGPIDLTRIRVQLAGESYMTRSALYARDPLNKGSLEYALDWVIVGGESGKNARPMNPFWARSLRDQCRDAGVPFFFKQWGEWVEWPDFESAEAESPKLQNLYVALRASPGDEPDQMRRVGKKAAGRLLDGIEHSEWPR